MAIGEFTTIKDLALPEKPSQAYLDIMKAIEDAKVSRNVNDENFYTRLQQNANKIANDAELYSVARTISQFPEGDNSPISSVRSVIQGTEPFASSYNPALSWGKNAIYNDVMGQLTSNTPQAQEAVNQFLQGGIGAVQDPNFKFIFEPYATYFRSGELSQDQLNAVMQNMPGATPAQAFGYMLGTADTQWQKDMAPDLFDKITGAIPQLGFSALMGNALGGAGLFDGMGATSTAGVPASAFGDYANMVGGAEAGSMLPSLAGVGSAGGTLGQGMLTAQQVASLAGNPEALAAYQAAGMIPSGVGGAALASTPEWMSKLSAMTGLSPSALTSAGSTGLGLLGSYIQGQSAQDAAQTSANAQLEAARIAAEAAKFRPVGVTTRFGQSQFGYDPQGNLTSAGYTVSPEIKAQQDALMAASGGMLNQFTGSQAATAPMGAGAQSAMSLGQSYLSTSPQEQAAKYMAEQQALLSPTRERQLAQLQNQLLAQGQTGLSMGGTSTGMTAANPALEAFFNAQRQQDLGLAAQATQGGMDYAKFGAGMLGAGGDLLKGMYGTQTASYAPYQTSMGGATMIEGLGQQPMDLGINIGAKGTASAAQSGQLLGQGMQNAAQTMQPANAYSPWAGLLAGAGQGISNYQQQQQQQQQQNKLLEYIFKR